MVSSAQATMAKQIESQVISSDKFIFSAGAETMTGETSYQIGYPIVTPSGYALSGYFPFSELKWPLDIFLGRLETSALLNERLRLTASVKKNISEPDDVMEDRDWLSPGRLDIYSESSISDFEATIAEVSGEWIFHSNQSLSFYGGLGYLYQNFEYEANLIRQFSPSGLPGYDVSGDGRVAITYDIQYYIPYVSIGTDFTPSENFKLSGRFALAPYVYAEDEDNHLLRENGGKISKGEMDGIGFFFDLTARYNITSFIFTEAGLHFTRLDVEGTQDQDYLLTGPIGEVTEEAESDQLSASITLGVRF